MMKSNQRRWSRVWLAPVALLAAAEKRRSAAADSSSSQSSRPCVGEVVDTCQPKRSATGLAISEANSSSRRSEEHTSELQSLMRISYAVFCLKNKNTPDPTTKLTPVIMHQPTQHTHSG